MKPMMKIDVVTLFPPMFLGPFELSMVKRAIDKKILDLKITDLREFATDKYKSVDDKPYGGGAGMIIRIDVIDSAITKLKTPSSKIIILDAAGERFTQKKAIQLSKEDHLIFLCGHYEGMDHRAHEHLADEVISIGDYVLSGGEIPAMVLIDSITRLLPGVLGNEKSLDEESHNDDSVEYPQYTRPEKYKDWKVPEVLLSGDHKKIKDWRQASQQSPSKS